MAKYPVHYGIRDAYKSYKDEGGNPHNIDAVTFSAICKEFFGALSDLVVYQAFDFKMPFRLGRLRIRKYMPKLRIKEDGTLDKSRLRPDWKATNELWARNPEAKINKQLVYHTNDHSDGYQHRWFWEKRTSNIPNHSAYCFIPCRNNKRTLATALKSDKVVVDYFE